MGYTTSFTGALHLSRALTISEAKTLMEIAEMDRTESAAITGINAYMQWVPSETLDRIVWDGNEKFYEYDQLLIWLCGWLRDRGIGACGELYWSGEEPADTGILRVIDNAVTVIEHKAPSKQSHKPLTMAALQKIALDKLTS